MNIIGIDAGLYSVKATLLHNDTSQINIEVLVTVDDVVNIVEKAVNKIINEAGIDKDSIYIVATGEGKEHLPFVDKIVPDAMCLARGIHNVDPGIRTVIDLGINKTMILRCSEGYVSKMVVSDKCAAGAGMYLQVLSQILDIQMDKMGVLALTSTEEIEIDTLCALFMETEIISLIHTQHKRVEDILMASYRSLVSRIYSLLLRVGIEYEIALVGGLAKDVCLYNTLKKQIDHEVVIPTGSKYIGSLGAALLGKEEVTR